VKATHGSHAAGMRDMGDMPPGRAMAMHHGMALWTQWVAVTLGLWLIASPMTLGYRSVALAWSDVVSGVAIVVLSFLAARPKATWEPWAASVVGIWLLFAPLVFWAPDASAFLNDWLVGALVIGFTILVPHSMEMPGPDIPSGWTYNPSSWMQRAPIVALGLVSLLIARYMAAFQLGHVGTAWDPIFGNGTERVLTSEVSKAWPISDAGLGALVYLTEVLMGVMGDPRRWRTMPWMVTMFFVAVVPLGITSIVLVILQPVAVGTWCTLCLATALFMLLMIPVALDEVVAMGQFLVRSTREGRGFWRTFFLGGEAFERARESKIARIDEERPAWMLRGVSFPPGLLASAALGLWLMFAPLALGAQAGAANAQYLIGPLIVTVALIATAEVARPVRYLNVALGLAAAITPFVLGGSNAASMASALVVGLAVAALSLPRGEVRERYGGFEALIV
jgi:hypothetical protein